MGGDGNGNNGNGNGASVKRCGVAENVVFLLAIACGTACSICSKTMMQLHGIGIDGDVELFQKPIFQTFGMFVGMIAGLVMHWIVLAFKLPFPGYDHCCVDDISKPAATGAAPTEKDRLLPPTKSSSRPPPKLQSIESGVSLEFSTSPAGVGNGNGNGTGASSSKGDGTPLWMYFFLAIPSVFDLAATAFCMMGLVHLDVSIYQLLRGSGIIFVALMKQHALGDHLYRFQWVGVFWNVVSVVLVGATAMLNSSGGDDDDDSEGSSRNVSTAEALLGVVLVLAGAFVQALQFVFEEKVMTMEDENASVPPLLLIGMEGLWGTILCVVIVYPLAYLLPGDDHGSYEDPFNTWHMLVHTPTIRWAFLVYFFVIFGYNLFAVLVTFLLNSVWHAILDNFRPITIWSADIFIYYVVTHHAFGEPWGPFSWVQVVGMFVLLYGTAVYNAPNAGSVELRGNWFNFGIDMSDEYDQIELEEKQFLLEEEEKEAAAAAATASTSVSAAVPAAEEEDRDWEERMQNFKTKRHSSLAERSPFTSVHTQALRSLGSPHI